MANWYKKQTCAQISRSLNTIADDIAKLADDINVAKSQYLKEKSNAKMWNDHTAITQINNSLNQCWQAVVSAARSLKLANNLYEAGNSIIRAMSLVEKVCQFVDCTHKSLSQINNALKIAYQKIKSVAAA